MVPETSGFVEEEEYILEEPSSRTYFIDFDRKCINLNKYESGQGDEENFIDSVKAMEQAIFCILNTERYEYLIYSWDYGVEMQEIIGIDEDILLSEIERRITEALLSDSRVVSVYNFDFEKNKKEVLCNFSVSTIYGDLEIEQEVEI